MLRFINPAQALARGDFMRAVAVYEYEGVPTDKVLHDRLQANWTTITANLAHNLEVEQKYGVYSFDKKGKQHWSDAAFAVLVERRGLADKWPKSPTGKYRLADAKRGSEEEKVFKHMALLDSYFEPLRQTRKILTEFKTFKLPIGSDARCRPGNIPYSQRTGRSSPKKGSIFALSAWVRWLIKPQPGRAIAYVDLVSAEFGIAAAISRDPAMMKLYSDKVAGLIEDVYLEIAKMAGAVPADAKMAEYRLVRALWKICCLMIQYGAWAGTVATMAGCSLSVATGIHRTHHELFNRYWSYIDRRRIEAQVGGIMQTRGGWKLRTKYQKAGTLGNFPVQAQAAEILQLASAHMVEDGIHLCATVHDAVLIEDSIENIDASVEKAKYWWRSASREILAYELDADVKVVRYPAVYEDKDGKAMYEMLMKLLDAAEQNQISQESVSQVLETADQDESLAEEACSYGTNSEVQGRQVRSL
jgi:hypothetical protein